MGGLFNDLFTGLSVGLLDGDVPGMVKNVAHGKIYHIRYYTPSSV